MRIQMKKNKDPKRVQRVLEELIRQLEQLTFMGPDGTQDKTRKISISSLNIYISFSDSASGVLLDFPDDWEVVPEAYCHTERKLLFSDPEQQLYIYPMPRQEKDEVE